MLVDPEELIDQGEAARLARLSLNGFKLAWREGRTPEPIMVAGRPLWLRQEIEDWTADRAAKAERVKAQLRRSR
jgi:hypothetical protein